VPAFIEYMHFDDKHPENKNIYVSNTRGKYAHIYNGKKWIICNKNERISKLFEDKKSILEDKFNEFDEDDNIDNITKKKFNRFLDELPNSKMKEILEDIHLILYNGKP